MLQVPRFKGRIVDINNGILDEGVGPDQFIAGGVVDNIGDLGLFGDAFGLPVEVTNLKSEGSELVVTSPDADTPDLDVLLVLDKLGVGDGATFLKGPLLLVDWHPATSRTPLVPGIS